MRHYAGAVIGTDPWEVRRIERMVASHPAMIWVMAEEEPNLDVAIVTLARGLPYVTWQTLAAQWPTLTSEQPAPSERPSLAEPRFGILAITDPCPLDVTCRLAEFGVRHHLLAPVDGPLLLERVTACLPGAGKVRMTGGGVPLGGVGSLVGADALGSADGPDRAREAGKGGGAGSARGAGKAGKAAATRAKRADLSLAPETRAQHEVDLVLEMAIRLGTGRHRLPRGCSARTLLAVTGELGRLGRASVAEIAAGTGLSRVSARRYLELLVQRGEASSSHEYGARGRPATRYELVADAIPQ